MSGSIIAIVSFLAGSGVTWFFARHYYLKASRERPEWADGLKDEVVAAYSASHPDADPGDLVKIFEQALEGRVIDGGYF